MYKVIKWSSREACSWPIDTDSWGFATEPEAEEFARKYANANPSVHFAVVKVIGVAMCTNPIPDIYKKF